MNVRYGWSNGAFQATLVSDKYYSPPKFYIIPNFVLWLWWLSHFSMILTTNSFFSLNHVLKTVEIWFILHNRVVINMIFICVDERNWFKSIAIILKVWLYGILIIWKNLTCSNLQNFNITCISRYLVVELTSVHQLLERAISVYGHQQPGCGVTCRVRRVIDDIYEFQPYFRYIKMNIYWHNFKFHLRQNKVNPISTLVV